MQTPIKILFAEDTLVDAELAARVLTKAGIDIVVMRVDTAPAFLDALDSFAPDIILSDHSMPHFDGNSALALAKEHLPHIPFIFLSGTIGEEVAIESLRRGAADYILKNNMGRLATAVKRALQDSKERAAKQQTQRELEQMQERFALFMEHLPGPAFMKDLEGRLQFVNRSFEIMANLSSEHLVGRTSLELWPQSAAIYDANDRWVAQENKVLQAFETFSQPDGDHCYLMHRFPIPNASGQPALIGGVAVDFTDRLVAEQKLARLSRIHAFLSGINSTIVRVRDKTELFQEACRIAVENGGFTLAWIGLLDTQSLDVGVVASVGNGLAAGSMIRTSARADIPEGQGIVGRAIRQNEALVISDIASDPTLAFEATSLTAELVAAAVLPVRVDGNVIGVLVLYAGGTHVFDHDEMKLLSELAGDISYALEYIEKTERLDYVAYYDPLTALPNRNLFSDRVNQIVNAQVDVHHRAAVVLLDLERFSLINDSLGRQAGDALLKLVAKRLQDALSSAGSVARLGADTFAISLPEVKDDADVARLVSERIAEAMSAPFTVGLDELRLAFKCGVAIFPGDGAEAESLLKNAETALKNAKQSGDRYLFYASAMNASVAGILNLENKLRIAITEQQFVLHYQPKIELATGRVEGLEALIRWNSPDFGMMSPLEFIPVLEETGMIVDVGLWVFRQAAADQQHWIAEGYVAPRVAVNVSAVQLRQKTFVADALAAISEVGGDPAKVDLEITESVIMQDIAQYIPKLQACRDVGMGVAIDDFGTGYSSLAYIGRLPLTEVKIDRSFVSAMTETDDNASIISTIISLAHLLKLRVIAEGVETTAQRDHLASLRCDTMQGYLISRPVASEKITSFLEKR